MEVYTRHSKAASAATRFIKQYPGVRTSKNKAIALNLINLGDTPSPEAVNAVIGNSSWTDISCDECGKDVYSVIQLGEEPEYESDTASVCLDCLRKAISMMEDKD